MRLILIESVENLGLPGDIIDVKPGYARNYLLPKGKALKATENNVSELEHQKRIADIRRKQIIDDLKVRQENIEGAKIEFKERVTETGKLYGSVSARRIAEALSEQFGELPASWIQLPDALKEVGEHTIELRLAPELTASVTVVIEGDIVVEERTGEEVTETEDAEETPDGYGELEPDDAAADEAHNDTEDHSEEE